MGRHRKPEVSGARTPFYARPAFRIVVGVVLTAVLLFVYFWWPEPREDVDPGSISTDDGLGVVIEPSLALEMYVPQLGLHAQFEADPCRLRNGAIDPITMDLACVYTAPDRPYVLPASNAEDVVVIAGHTGAGTDGVFDSLYDGVWDRHRVELGDVLYLRTVNSGSDWLTYQATDLHSPEKDGLSQSTQIWGSEPTPGRLLTISCVQPANPLAASVRNAVVGWQFTGVVADSNVNAMPAG